MKRYCVLYALVLGIAVCGWSGRLAAEAVPVITEAREIAKHVGQTITIVGEVSDTKVPQILGVDVTSESPDLRGHAAEATGILERYEVTEAQVREMDRAHVAHRGAGVFFRLRDEQRNTDAQAQERH